MELYLLKAFHFVTHDRLPYRKDGRGGHTFYQCGSHVLFSDLRNRWYRFAIEVATVNEPEDSILEATRLVAQVDGENVGLQQGVLDWDGDYRKRTSLEQYSCYRWTQCLEIDLDGPALVTIRVEMKFKGQDDYFPVDGVTRVLVDMHPGQPPTHYGKPMWYLKKWLGKKS